MIEVVGWIGGVCLAFCALPQAVRSWKDKRTPPLSMAFLGLWTLGELFSFAYAIGISNWPVTFNCAVNLACLAVIIWYVSA